jgi:ATP-binding cassette subfamily B protein
MSLLIGMSTLITIWIGGLDVVHQVPGATVGKIAEFVLYIQMLTFPVSAIGWTASMIQRAAASQKRINEFLQTQPEIKEPEKPYIQPLDGNVEFKNIGFTYKHTSIKAVHDFSLKIKKGEKIAIVGKTGSGKSTIAQLLLRMFDPQEGDILLDDVPVKNISLDTIRNGISYVPQDVFLFSDTIKNNIQFGKANATAEEVHLAAQNAGIFDEIISFENGFDTMVGERGITLSGGQKQRISIARAMIKDAQLVIFDDCLSAVDSKTESRIVGHLHQYLSDKTAIIITHRIFSLFNFDRIIVMQDGEIAESGSHESLLSKKGLYYEMFKRQRETMQE